MKGGEKAHVPVGPIRRVLLDWEMKQDYQDGDGIHFRGATKFILPLHPIVRLAGFLNVNVDTLWNIRGREKKKWVEFDLADKIIAYIDPSLWRDDVELEAIYQSFDLAFLDELYPVAA